MDTKQSKAGGKPAPEVEKTPEQIAAENEALRKRVAELEAGQQQAGADDAEIRKRQSKGLTREQAEAAVRNQRAYEAHKAKRKEKGSK